ncbi:MAG: hypothetical protein ABI683_07375 [Ginsengibacter sp.]
MKRNSVKFFVFAIILIAIIFSILGYRMWNKPHVDIMDTIAIRVDAIDLYKDFVNDSALAKIKFINRILQVAGVVKSVSVNQQHEQVILLETPEPDASVNCTIEGKEINIKPGEAISLKGICIGYIGDEANIGLPGDVFLIRCYHVYRK